MTAPATKTRGIETAGVFTAEIVGLFAQLALLGIGVQFVFIEDDQIAEIGLLLIWCTIGTLYLIGTITWMNVDLRMRAHDNRLLRNFVGGPVVRWFSVLVTFSASLVGLTAATTLIVMHGDPDHLKMYELAAVWAMLVSWAMFHWGYARIYHSYFYRAPEPPLHFPGTEEPRLSDFAYFSFTNGTSFAPSDVQIISSRMRWTVVWHTTFSFFFNALIIVLTMNTIVGGFSLG